VSNEYNQKEESDQIDKALEEYIEAQKKDENLEKETTSAWITSSFDSTSTASVSTWSLSLATSTESW
jgi:metal-responsive CopG/Arc/MetJ family transcriptional regulator